MREMRELVIVFTIAIVLLILSISQFQVKERIYILEIRLSALQELQQERLEAFSKDVYNMTSITELLEEQAKILEVIERRTR